jgi:predicted MPP superfamily phosphohydrolase
LLGFLQVGDVRGQLVDLAAVQDMVGSNTHHDFSREPPAIASAIVDPRQGDIEDDASSTIQRSFLAIAGSLLAEISLPKLLFACTLSILLPAILLGLAPLLATAWVAKVSASITGLGDLGAMLALLLVAAVGWYGWRPLLRTVEANFWSLNALAVQPGYALFREALRHLAERSIGDRSNALKLARLRAASSAGAGVILCAFAASLAFMVWPATRWVGTVTDILILQSLIIPTVANAVVVVSIYMAIAALVWGVADASMEQPCDVRAFDPPPSGGRTWRVAHLSDIHVVGERYGFRIESGRSGPRGNDRLERVLDHIEAVHLVQPLDFVLISGDLTDAGRSPEWAEFLDIVARHPVLAERMVVLPGNHDVNIVDRTNPASLNLPFSPAKRLRQMRALSALATVQGDRMRVVDRGSGELAHTLAGALAAHQEKIAAFARTGSLRLSSGLGSVWNDQFPMILPPSTEEGLGVAVLNSNAETHFSFTNALGLISAEQARRLAEATGKFPRALWIIALHHHLLEYPMPVSAFSERVGTALINGSWFVRKLKPLAGRAIVMHGHRHIDWIGACGRLKIVSAPSPIMSVRNDEPTYFHIHTLAAGSDGRLQLLSPQRVDIAGT